MATVANEVIAAGHPLPAQTLTQNPIFRQVAAMIGIAASVALGVAVVLWSQTPTYSLLHGDLSQRDASEVIGVLEQANIEFKVDNSSGALMVPSGKLRDARMKLAGEGLPRGDSLGFELLQQETGLGTSRALEAARFHRALEGELARTIATIANVASVRVHLATPKQSVFVRKRKVPSASVVLKLYSGRNLEKSQVAAIVHLVASSVPELDTSNVTLVDQKGRLLSGAGDSRDMMLSASQFEYSTQLEEHYRQRVEDILTPILGMNSIRAEVTAEVDFTVTERTDERFNPDLPALRSEQINEQASRLSAVQGVPGALSNQPPAAGQAPEVAGGAEGTGAQGDPLNTSLNSTRNYELDKSISHTRLSSGNLRRLSVAVVIDDRAVAAEDGTITRTERTPEEISRITQLVKEAVGFSQQRGDTVHVVNAPFLIPPEPEPLPEIAIWEQPWVWDLSKQVGGVLLVLILIFFVLMPTMKKLAAPPVIQRIGSNDENQTGSPAAITDARGQPSPSGITEDMMLPGPEGYENTLDAARGLVNEDPKRVAQVVRQWVAEDGG
ncbi:MAG: flagellar basal body M-ring protein FliF [Gammaproteobacteria bacterium]|nr:flagellar basal body M-ring protein FliF [Gammaproteobacteria bacterium]